MDEFRIAKERIAILIGKKGEIKRKISQLTKTKLLMKVLIVCAGGYLPRKNFSFSS